MNRQERQIHTREVERICRQYERKYFPKVRDSIKAKVSSLISMVKERGIQGAMNALSTDLTNPELVKAVHEMHNEVGLRFARKQWRAFNEQRRLLGPKRKDDTSHLLSSAKNAKILFESMEQLEGKGFGFNADWVQFIKDYLFKFLIDKITFQVTQTTREVLLNVLQEAINEGWGIDETVRHLDELPLSETQAARIVRTEITRAANTGTMAASSTFEFEQTKEWIAAHDSRTRGNPIDGQSDHADHWDLDGQVIDEHGFFIDPRNGDRLRFPGDPQASAASTINCRCSVAVVAKVNEMGRLIPKQNIAA